MRKYPNFIIKKNRSGVNMIALQAFCWLLFAVYEIGFVYYTSHFIGNVYNYLIYYSINITQFYVQLEILNKLSYKRKFSLIHVTLLFLSAVAGFLLIKVLAGMILLQPDTALGSRLKQAWQYLPLDLFRGVYYSIYAIFFWVGINIERFHKQSLIAENGRLSVLQQKAAVEQKLVRAENAHLQQQLNPHLLFNSLNFVYSSVLEHSEEASENILLLTDILRYSLEPAGTDGKKWLTDELLQLNNMIRINAFRFDDRLNLKENFQVSSGNLRIIPLILLTLTENIFKHGLLTDTERPAFLTVITDQAGKLTFRSFNQKRRMSHMDTNATGGIGMQNVRIRLEQYYPGNYQLDVIEDAERFELNLTITL